MNTKEILDRIFKDPRTTYELTEFDNLGKPVDEILEIYSKTIDSGREAGKIKYFLKSIVPFSSGKDEVQVYTEDGKSSPEEIVRQLWVYKLLHVYDYKTDEIELEKSIYFGTEVNIKAADIVVYTDTTKQTPKIIIEVKKPKRKDGIEQLKSYMNAQGAPVAVWSNGSDSVILYRPYPKEFDDTLSNIPRRGQEPKDVLEAKKTLSHLRKTFNFKKIVQDLEELVLADSGVDEFNEIFKLIFAKIWDEKEAQEKRKNKEIEFRKSIDTELTYDRINGLFHKASEEWPGVFRDGEDIDLRKDHLQVCIGPIEGVRLLGSNLRIMDDAFEYLLAKEAKKKKGQFFTPRHVVEMCVRMLNPKLTEHVIDPACGSGGFLLHAMDWCYPVSDNEQRELRKHKYAAKYLWGIDFELRAAKTSRALMLIAGDGHTNIFGPDVNSLDPRTWYTTQTGQILMQKLVESKLLSTKVSKADEANIIKDDDLAWKYFDELSFDIAMTNPPFAGELKDKKMLAHYDLAKPALKCAKDKQAKVERDVIFLERIIKLVKPGGRAAIVLPQGQFNNSSLAFIREWILRKARILAVVGLHQNTFKPHTGTKTSVLFVQKYTQEDLDRIDAVKQKIASSCPDYEAQIKTLIEQNQSSADIPEENIPEDIAELLLEVFAPEEAASEENGSDEESKHSEEVAFDQESLIEQAEEKLVSLKDALIKAKHKLADLGTELDALRETCAQEIIVLEKNWSGPTKELSAKKRALQAQYKDREKKLLSAQKEQKKKLIAEIKSLEKAVTDAEYELKILTNRGKLELVLADAELIGRLKDRWIDAEVAKKLDYPIFMAISERGGKDSSGDYEYLTDEDGNLIEFPEGHPQEGHLMINQDLVNYELTFEHLKNACSIPDDKVYIAEAFIRFAQKNGFDFWRVD